MDFTKESSFGGGVVGVIWDVDTLWDMHIKKNAVCADCGLVLPEPRTAWASVNLGICLCIECAGCHRNMGVDVSKVLSLGIDQWSAGQKEAFMALGGNVAANARVAGQTPPAEDWTAVSREVRNAWIVAKWKGVPYIRPGGRSRSHTQTTVHAGILKIELKCGRNLPIADLSGKSDPYIVFACGRWDKKHKLKQGEKHSVKSSVKRQTLNPDWDETLMLNVPSLSEGLTAWCWDWDSPPKPHDSMGYCFVDLLDLQDGVPMEFAPPLSKKGFLRFVLTFTML